MLMKKILLTLVMGIGLLTASAQSLDYLTFRTANGAEKSLPIEGMKITIENGTLKVSTPTGVTNFSIADLSCFFFAAQPTGITTAEGNDNWNAQIIGGQLETNAPEGSTIRIYGIDGKPVPRHNLPAGVYIIQINDKTFKTIAR